MVADRAGRDLSAPVASPAAQSDLGVTRVSYRLFQTNRVRYDVIEDLARGGPSTRKIGDRRAEIVLQPRSRNPVRVTDRVSRSPLLSITREQRRILALFAPYSEVAVAPTSGTSAPRAASP